MVQRDSGQLLDAGRTGRAQLVPDHPEPRSSLVTNGGGQQMQVYESWLLEGDALGVPDVQVAISRSEDR